MCVALVASVLADEALEAQKVVLPALYGQPWPYFYATHQPVVYTVPAPIQYKYVPKEVEIEIKTYLRTKRECVNACVQTCDKAREAQKIVLPALSGQPWPYFYAAHHPVAYTVPAPVQYKGEKIEIKTYQRTRCLGNCRILCQY